MSILRRFNARALWGLVRPSCSLFPVPCSLVVGATLALAASSNWPNHVPAKDHARANPLAGRTEAVQAGALLYRDHCQQCHQADAAGDGKKKPSLKTDRITSATDGDLEWFLRQGDLGHGMPSWSSLPEGQRWQIISYLRSLQQTPPTGP